MENTKILCENLARLRKKKNLTQKKVAELLEISQQAYYKYEKNIAQPDIEALVNLSKIYDISIDELLGNDKFVTQNSENALIIPDEKKPVVELLLNLPEVMFANIQGQIELYAKYANLK